VVKFDHSYAAFLGSQMTLGLVNGDGTALCPWKFHTQRVFTTCITLLEVYQGVVKFDHSYAAFPHLRVLESFIMKLCELSDSQILHYCDKKLQGLLFCC
jgi:hypothetical protein